MAECTEHNCQASLDWTGHVAAVVVILIDSSHLELRKHFLTHSVIKERCFAVLAAAFV